MEGVFRFKSWFLNAPGHIHGGAYYWNFTVSIHYIRLYIEIGIVFMFAFLCQQIVLQVARNRRNSRLKALRKSLLTMA